ncbi:MAG TPA: HAMP domain-containing sensor histidine kinase [Usitatibacter sp.]|nr:HAMP domain-containing sensor histidine kinase [Usitatibacter sp.]
MLREFIESNRAELINRCRARVSARRAPRATPFELEHGIPTFIDQLAGMLPGSGMAPVATDVLMDLAAVKHGGELLKGKFPIDQVVHDYGDLCQAITELAQERGAPITVPEFSVLNLLLDNAIAAAVGEWSRGSEASLGRLHATEMNERLGMLGHEMRNKLNTAILALAAIRSGGVGFGGGTAAALDRSLLGMRDLIDRSLSEVRLRASNAAPLVAEPIEISSFLHEMQVAAALEASSLGCELTVLPIDHGVMVFADRQILAGAVANLLQNAFKFGREGGHVILRARTAAGRVLIEVQDECGGLPTGSREIIFKPFEQAGRNRAGVGLGLAISRKGVEADGGTLSVRDLPGEGCVFVIDLPEMDKTH